jgi:hypothetical protein
MIVVFWSPFGFPVIQTLLPKMTFALKFFADVIFARYRRGQASL